MGLIREEIEHSEFRGMSLRVIEREEGETREPWKMCALEFEGWEYLSPSDVREIGKWLVQQGRRIGRQYKSNGAQR